MSSSAEGSRSGRSTGGGATILSPRLKGATDFFKRHLKAGKKKKQEKDKDSEWATLLKFWVVLVWLIVIMFFLSQTDWDWAKSDWFVGIVLPIIGGYIVVTLLSFVV